MENTEQKALAELKRVYYLINNGDLNQEGFTLYHTIGRILEDFEKAKSRELSEAVRPVVVLPSEVQIESYLKTIQPYARVVSAFAYGMALETIKSINPDMTFREPIPHGLEPELKAPCQKCGGKMVIVRPGSWQCDKCGY